LASRSLALLASMFSLLHRVHNRHSLLVCALAVTAVLYITFVITYCFLGSFYILTSSHKPTETIFSEGPYGQLPALTAKCTFACRPVAGCFYMTSNYEPSYDIHAKAERYFTPFPSGVQFKLDQYTFRSVRPVGRRYVAIQLTFEEIGDSWSNAWHDSSLDFWISQKLKFSLPGTADVHSVPFKKFEFTKVRYAESAFNLLNLSNLWHWQLQNQVEDFKVFEIGALVAERFSPQGYGHKAVGGFGGPGCFIFPGADWRQVPQVDVEACDETINTVDFGKSYRGCQTKTVSGRTCQRWDMQQPYSHTRTVKNYPRDDLRGNYCRNPDDEATIWCYTTDPERRWEHCLPVGTRRAKKLRHFMMEFGFHDGVVEQIRTVSKLERLVNHLGKASGYIAVVGMVFCLLMHRQAPGHVGEREVTFRVLDESDANVCLEPL